MEEIKNILRTMQEEIRQQKVDMLDMKEDIKNHNQQQYKRETKNELLEQKLEIQAIKISNLENTLRRKNLLIFGVAENERNYWDLMTKVLDIINNTLHIKCDSNNIECVRRLGKQGEKVRPIVMSLTTIGLKIKIQQNKKKLQPTPYYIQEDFPSEILNKRKELQVEVNKLREQGKLAILKYDKIVILKNRNQQPETQSLDNKKRPLSESPEAPRSDHENQKEKQPTKINKTNRMDSYLLRKQTLHYASEKASRSQDSHTSQ
ncbi:hypothetical protein MSG28_011387 [Choristoneura fumiferana]|uniref:Uncharacterized protein n=1 Tax=Choristoneura fumiferana TaxID=7141 RepID=A0ACC0JN43_CHOFU|nr:hypothetical protein MSG28_011387 [Choristoneura fumiferana]